MQVYEVWYYAIELGKSESHTIAAADEQAAIQAMMGIAAQHSRVIRILSVSAA